MYVSKWLSTPMYVSKKPKEEKNPMEDEVRHKKSNSSPIKK